MSLNDYDFLFKILLLGDSGAGKSAILNRYCDEIFTDGYISTIGVDFKIKTIEIDGLIIKLQIWDTAGQERFKSITSSYYRGAYAILGVFDITDLQSYRNLNQIWIPEVHKSTVESKMKPLFFYVGTKCDLKKDSVIDSEVKNLENYYETSSKKNIGINEMIINICKKILEQVNNQSLIVTTSSVYIPSTNTNQINKKIKCC
jgi:Ras-related protein Rab-1A